MKAEESVKACNPPFEGDTFIGPELRRLRDLHGLKWCVETGTQFGATTLALLEIFPMVATIEADDVCFKEAEKNLAGRRVFMVKGRSDEVLLPWMKNDALYYLDAHGGSAGGCPLKAELEIIARFKPRNIVIAIHDFQVPGKDFGFDVHDYPLTLPEIEPWLPRIFKLPAHHYNEQADGAQRGIIYIYESA